jgi:pSer/pThr/pTyr-binding forkhead associated (FHA) protein
MAESDSTADATLAGVSPPELSLLVVSGTETSMVPLPRQGRLTIGRGDATDIQIDDTLASREHAEIEVQERLFVTDLGSKNGTTLAGVALTPNQRTELVAGQSIEIGSTLIVVQRTRRPPRPARTVSHPYFEGRVEDAEERGRPFVLARIHLADQGDAPALVAKSRRLLGPEDILALLAPGELEILLQGPAAADPSGWLSGSGGLRALDLPAFGGRTGSGRAPGPGL